MSQNNKTALIHRWPSDFVDRLKVVAEDHLMPVQSFVFGAVREKVDKEYKRIQREREQIAEPEESR